MNGGFLPLREKLLKKLLSHPEFGSGSNKFHIIQDAETSLPWRCRNKFGMTLSGFSMTICGI